METTYGAFLDKQKIEFDLNCGGYIKYRGSFRIDVDKCVDKIEALKEIHRRIGEVAMIDPETARKIKEAVERIRIVYDHSYGGLSVEYDEIDNEEDGFRDPFEKLSEILENESCINLHESLERELDSVIKDEFEKLLYNLKDEFSYLISDEVVIETLNANGFLFTEKGEKIPGFYVD